LTNQIGRFDPHTGNIKVIDLPTGMARADERTPLPYGIDVNPVDGSVWYSKLWANKIGRVDPKTFAVQEFIPPVVGPRRLRFDASGTLWIPGFGDGTLAKLDTRSMKYRVYRIPGLSSAEVEAPYAIAVDPKTQDVWITSNMSDRMIRFEPKSAHFISYALPTRGTYSRDIFFTPDGQTCASSSPMPPKPVGPGKQTVEGDMDALVCIQPKGETKGAI
jgi:virginiamycin B lyase